MIPTHEQAHEYVNQLHRNAAAYVSGLLDRETFDKAQDTAWAAIRSQGAGFENRVMRILCLAVSWEGR